MDNTKIKQLMLQLSQEAGEYLRNNFHTLKNMYAKDAGGVVTNVDLKLEEMLVNRIKKEFPDHGINVIDSKTLNPDSEFMWIIDALDGSSHFSRNIPIYASSIAFQHKGKTIFGAVNHPETHELFFAEIGKGAQLNGIDISVSDVSDLQQAYVYVELPEQKFLAQKEVVGDFHKHMQTLQNLIEKCKQVETFRIGTFGQCLVASGSFDAYVDLSGSSKELSQTASSLILREAGGNVTDLDKSNDGFVRVMATNGKLTI